MAENGASALRQAAPAERSSLGLRVASALVLVPLALVVVWAGGIWLAVWVALAAGIMAWEWGRLVGACAEGLDGALLFALGGGTVLLGALAGAAWAALVLCVGLGLLRLRSLPGGHAWPWLPAGLVWIAAPSLGFLWLRARADGGLASAFWLLALVWAVDSAAYAVGRSVGGPRLAPHISPNKTWAGLLGGVAGAVAVGSLTAWLAGLDWTRLAALSGGLAILEQIGDIAESYAKRRFGAKDSGSLIPGHGGLLDRLDGMLAVTAAVTIISLLMGESVVPWR